MGPSVIHPSWLRERGRHGGSIVMVTDAVCVTGPMNAPMMATSVSSTYVAVTVIWPSPTAVSISTGRATERAAASRAAAAGRS